MEGPKGKHIFGIVKVGEKGQIVIPKEARSIFNIKSGDSLLVLGDENSGIAIVKPDLFQKLTDIYFKEMEINNGRDTNK